MDSNTGFRAENVPADNSSNTNPANRVEAAAPALKERRRSPRFNCSGSAELQSEGSDARMWGTLTDISLHGCYIEMSTTFPVNTKVSLQLESLGVKVQVKATVLVSYPFLGMGLCFNEIEPAQQTQLGQLLRALAGERALLRNGVEKPGLPDVLASCDPRACLDAVADFFKKEANLSREEFYQIAKRVCRS